MLKPEQVPREAWLAVRDYVVERPYGYNLTEAIAAAINAWPGVRLGKYRDVAGPNDRIILPLNTESGND